MPILKPMASLLDCAGLFSGPLHVRPASRLHGEVDLVLKAPVLSLGEKGSVVCDDPAQVVDPGPFAFSEITQHMVLHQSLVAGMADAEAYAAILVAAMGRDGAKPVMAGIAAADLHAQLGGRKIELVVEDRHVMQRNFEEVLRFPHRLA